MAPSFPPTRASTTSLGCPTPTTSIHQLRSKVSEEHEVIKKKELETGPKASYGYGGKFGTERDRMDKITPRASVAATAWRRTRWTKQLWVLTARARRRSTTLRKIILWALVGSLRSRGIVKTRVPLAGTTGRNFNPMHPKQTIPRGLEAAMGSRRTGWISRKSHKERRTAQRQRCPPCQQGELSKRDLRHGDCRRQKGRMRKHHPLCHQDQQILMKSSLQEGAGQRQSSYKVWELSTAILAWVERHKDTADCAAVSPGGEGRLCLGAAEILSGPQRCHKASPAPELDPRPTGIRAALVLEGEPEGDSCVTASQIILHISLTDVKIVTDITDVTNVTDVTIVTDAIVVTNVTDITIIKDVTDDTDVRKVTDVIDITDVTIDTDNIDVTALKIVTDEINVTDVTIVLMSQ
ncbi:uncharacterized protein [Phaenicophaeus curvirostris]|uniref:uncharacterized protein isoform X2 n=1 Tax=Phaenicophaeus curvirostris TaxID=33595 RepID=UPI0037F0C276